MNEQDEVFIELSDLEFRRQRVQKQLHSISNDLFTITFCGKLKSGKSSLINTFLGTKLLPTKFSTATAVITKIFYSNQVTVYVVKERKTIPISLDEIDKYILAVDKDLYGIKTSGVSEVCIGIPNKLLSGIMLVDTPGMDDEDNLTEVSLKEIHNADLAVIVYDANQLLSWNEKMTVEQINELLNGNVIFAINRIDQMEDGNLEEVKEVGQNYLSRYGNDYVGKGRIFYTAADGKTQNIADFYDWIIKTITSAVRKNNISRLSRLSVIKNDLGEDMGLINRGANDLSDKIKVMQEKNNTIITEKKTEKKCELTQLKNQLAEFKLGMLGLVSSDCIDICRRELDKVKSASNWRVHFSTNAKKVTEDYFANFFYSNRVALLKSYQLNFVAVPSLSISGVFDTVYFPDANDASSGWGAAAIGAGIGTAIMPVVGTAIGAGIGKLASWWKADDAAIENCIPVSIVKIKNEVVPKVRKRIEDFFDQLESNIEKYQQQLSFVGGYEDEIAQYEQLLESLFLLEYEAEDIRQKVLLQITTAKQNCKISE